MKTQDQCRTFTRALLAAVLLTAPGRLLAQDAITNAAPTSADTSASTTTVAPAAAPATTPTPDAAPASTVTLAPQLSYGVSSIVQLSQANVGDATILKYIQTGGSGYGLNADQIIYLKQQGVSDAVVNAMLSQPSQPAPVTTVAMAPAAAPDANAAPAPDYSTPSVNANYQAEAAPVAAVNPAPVPPVSVYVIPAPPTTTIYSSPATPYLYYHPGYAPGYSACSSVSVVYIGGSYARHGTYRPGWRR